MFQLILEKEIENLFNEDGRHTIPKTTNIDKEIYIRINPIAKFPQINAENMTIAEEKNGKYFLKIPNKEIKMEFKNIITEYHRNT